MDISSVARSAFYIWPANVAHKLITKSSVTQRINLLLFLSHLDRNVKFGFRCQILGLVPDGSLLTAHRSPLMTILLITFMSSQFIRNQYLFSPFHRYNRRHFTLSILQYNLEAKIKNKIFLQKIDTLLLMRSIESNFAVVHFFFFRRKQRILKPHSGAQLHILTDVDRRYQLPFLKLTILTSRPISSTCFNVQLIITEEAITQNQNQNQNIEPEWYLTFVFCY